MKPIFRQLWALTRELHVLAWRTFKRRWPWFVLGLVVVMAGVAWMLPHDKAWLADIRQPEYIADTHPPEFTPVNLAARQLSYWGDFFKINVIVFVIGLPLAVIFKSVRWQRIMLAVFIGALWGGIAVNVLRPAIGRPRPSENVADGMYLMQFKHGYHSFPSGHTTTAFASATVVTFICPPAGLIAYPLAGSISWSRMQLNRHHPADILGGIGLGVAFGVLFGSAVRGRTRQ
ncbi:phosphatase PAP2 family protein [Ruficoccus amylovorans]|uniref:Phosphatase PAP2 family protein n=1 Tax=Ruficoccus amylovorans TaxID=1804625 RepID=A0A842HBN3_9BACT|nr:phosphatase PAP2 family protein [Ruficoccus amylovorans]MBC2593116.1 phosphatase PAP2 family protein [Ruficoccus amylovorans]